MSVVLYCFAARNLTSCIMVEHRVLGLSKPASQDRITQNASSRLCASSRLRQKRDASEPGLTCVKQRRTAKACAGHGRRTGGRRLHRAQGAGGPRTAQDQVPDGARDRDRLGRHGTNMELGIRGRAGYIERRGTSSQFHEVLLLAEVSQSTQYCSPRHL